MFGSSAITSKRFYVVNINTFYVGLLFCLQ